MINKCVCFNLTFAEIIEIAKKNNWNLEDIQKNLGCGTRCELCVPYIQISIKTGQKEF